MQTLPIPVRVLSDRLVVTAFMRSQRALDPMNRVTTSGATRPARSGAGQVSLVLLFLVLLAPGRLAAEPFKHDMVLYKHDVRYSAFPSLSNGPGDRLWVRFGWNTTRSHYGKAAGGETGGIGLFSPDGGKTWLQRGEDSQYQAPPENLSSMQLRDGTLVRISPRMHEVLPGEKKDELVAQGVAVKEWPDGHISASYRVFMQRKRPGGDGWESRQVELPRFASMGGFGRGCVLPDVRRSGTPSYDTILKPDVRRSGTPSYDTILKPVYGRMTPDDPAGRAWVLRSTDQGDTWDLVTIAHDGVHQFNEAELLCVPGGRVIAMIRNEPYNPKLPRHEQGFLWQTYSDDGGRTWSEPQRTEMWGYPPDLLLLESGDVLCTYGYRRQPYGVRACFSRDGGATWDVAHEVILRSDALPDGPGPGKGYPSDLGYPRSVELSDGSIFTAYYITLGDGVTHIAATRWSPDYVGPADLARGPAAIPKPDPSLPPAHVIGESGPTRLVYGLMQSFIATEPQIKVVAVRVSDESARDDLVHTHGLSVVLREPGGKSWWTEWMGESRVLKPEEVECGAWNAFVFDEPVAVTPGETYVLTVYNKDYVGGGETRLKDGLSGDHAWYLNSGPGRAGDYPNGGMSPGREDDLAFRVDAEPGPLPAE